MRRFFIALFPLLLGQCIDGSVPAAITPAPDQRLQIESAPVMLDASHPDRRRIGALTFLGGWSLTSETRGFGTMSAIDVDGDQVTALGDNGSIIRFRLGRFGNISDAEVFRVPDTCGTVVSKHDNDTEALTHSPDRQTWWISYEWRNRICRTNDDISAAEMTVEPASIATWPRKNGAETMLRLSDGRFLIIAEDVKSGRDPVRAVLFDRDPTDPEAKAALFGFRPPEGYRPVDATQLPDGRILVLNRRFALPALFTSKIVLVDAIGTEVPAILEGRTIATLEAPAITDNFEGIAAEQVNGQTIIWLVSDDNLMRWQRTLLLKFKLN